MTYKNDLLTIKPYNILPSTPSIIALHILDTPL